MKKLILLFVTLCMVISTWAYNFTSGGLYYSITSSTSPYTVELSYNNMTIDRYSGAINIPTSVIYEGVSYSVTSIGSSAFSYCSNLTNVTIPSTVTSIASYAFSASSITAINIPSTVTSIDSHAFYNCANLSSLILNKGLLSTGEYSFSGCTGLTSVAIPSSVTDIGDHSFADCTGIISLSIENGVASINSYAFSGCTGLTNVHIPSSVIWIESVAFVRCTGLISFTVDASNPNYYSSDDGVLFDKINKKLTCFPGGKPGSYTIPSGILTIDFGSFSYCIGLTSVTIPSSVSYIGSYAFEYSPNLKSVTFDANSSVPEIRNYTFQGCTGLSSINIPSSVSSINDYAFQYCTSLSSIFIPSSVVSFGDQSFEWCTGLSSVTFGDGSLLKQIGYADFFGCSSLTSITIPSQVTIIGLTAFQDCISLTSIDIPLSVTTISSMAFYGCTGLKTVTIPSSVTGFGIWVFKGCSGLTSVSAYATTPVDISSSNEVFGDVNKTSCVLHVPVGSAKAYKAADQWKDFLNIREDLPSAVLSVEASILTVSVQNGQLKVSNVPVGETLTIFTQQGKIVYAEKINANSVAINLPLHGVYVVKVGLKAVKAIY